MPVDPNSRLRDCIQEQAGLSLPSPLNARLDVLVDIANEAGENTTRKEVVASLLLASSADGKDLGDKIKRYRVALASDAVPPGVTPSQILGSRQRKPGPRRRRASF